MSDNQLRELVINQLGKLTLREDEACDATVYVGQLRNGIQVAWGSLSRMFESGDKIHALPASIWNGISENGRVSGWYLLFQLIGLVVLGTIAERIARQILERTRLKPVEAGSSGKRVGLAIFGAAMGLIELGAFVGERYPEVRREMLARELRHRLLGAVAQTDQRRADAGEAAGEEGHFGRIPRRDHQDVHGSSLIPA